MRHIKRPGGIRLAVSFGLLTALLVIVTIFQLSGWSFATKTASTEFTAFRTSSTSSSVLEDGLIPSCRNVDKLPREERCAFVKGDACKDQVALFNYLALRYCNLDCTQPVVCTRTTNHLVCACAANGFSRFFTYVLLVCWSAVLLSLMASTGDCARFGSLRLHCTFHDCTHMPTFWPFV